MILKILSDVQLEWLMIFTLFVTKQSSIIKIYFTQANQLNWTKKSYQKDSKLLKKSLLTKQVRNSMSSLLENSCPSFYNFHFLLTLNFWHLTFFLNDLWAFSVTVRWNCENALLNRAFVVWSLQVVHNDSSLEWSSPGNHFVALVWEVFWTFLCD